MVLLHDSSVRLVIPILRNSTHPEVGRCLAESDNVGHGTHELLEAQVAERGGEEGHEVLELGLRDINSEVVKRHGGDSAVKVGLGV